MTTGTLQLQPATHSHAWTRLFAAMHDPFPSMRKRLENAVENRRGYVYAAGAGLLVHCE
jgi:hypothetical protein